MRIILFQVNSLLLWHGCLADFSQLRVGNVLLKQKRARFFFLAWELVESVADLFDCVLNCKFGPNSSPLAAWAFMFLGLS